MKLRRILSRLGVYVGLAFAGCASQSTLGQWEGPTEVVKASVQEWAFEEQKARILVSEHYRVHTTIKDEEVLELLPQVMEGALSMYRTVAPQVAISDRPLECYIFRWRSEWDTYTQRATGTDARIYLQIRSGGYTVRDRYVAYYIGRLGTFAVAAHEGWHQFAGRHFKGRMPPFLEEGLACMFETISWKGNVPRFNLSLNPPRAETLRKAIEANQLLSLQELCAMHAGDIVGEDSLKIDAFYAQCWAFARFLWEAEGNKYRPAMQKWLAETAAGTVKDPTRSHNKSYVPWNRGAVRPMLEHYLGMDIKSIDKAYVEFMKQIAHEELNAHWRM